MDITANEEMSPMLTIKQVATLLHVHVNTVRRWSDRGLIKSYQINHRGDRRFLQKDVTSFLVDMNTKYCENNDRMVV
jgi:excisionase family DNA binding protein